MVDTSELAIRLACAQELEFVGQDGYLSPEVLLKKIARGEVIVAVLATTPVGYVRLEYLWSLVPYIALIRVAPNDRRSGIGRAMLQFIEKRLRAVGHTALYSSSQADEHESQAWHRRVGFEECGIIVGINKGGVGEIFFRKHLLLPSQSL